MKKLLGIITIAFAGAACEMILIGRTRTDSVAPVQVSFSTRDGGLIFANLYGRSDRGVVLAHGGRRNKESWDKQARELVKAGFTVLTFDFRGLGLSKGPPQARQPEDGRHYDVLGAVDYLRKAGAKRVSVVGASMGGDYAAEAAEAEPGEIDRLVLIAAGGYTPLTKLKGRKLYIISRADVIGDNKPRLPMIRAQYEKSSEPKEMVILEGSAHAQFIFETDQGERLMAEILRFLSAK